MRIITMELEHPERFISFSDGSGPLARWNGTIAELLEYTIPLQIAGRLSANSGEPLSYTDAVKLVEQIFGITISSPYDRKTKLLSRKKNDTPFLDKMRVVFREEAEKIASLNQRVTDKISRRRIRRLLFYFRCRRILAPRKILKSWIPASTTSAW